MSTSESSLENTAAGLRPPERGVTTSRRTGLAIVIGSVAWALPTIGAQATLIPAQVAIIAPDQKYFVVGALATVGAVTSLIFAVVWGAVSDRTRTRFGGRTPWIVIGGALCTVLMVLLSTAHEVWQMFLWWALFEIAVNMITPALLAFIPDRVPLAKRGGVSSAYGVGVLAASAIGSIVGAQFLTDPSVGMLILAPVSLILCLVCVLIAPDRSNKGVPRTTMNLAGFVKSFSIPRHAPDFAWAFWGRLALNLGAQMISTYQLYIVSDYLHLNESDTAAVISIGSGIYFFTSLIASGVSGPIADKIKRFKMPVIAASIVFVIAILIPFIWPTATGMLIYFALFGIGYGVYFAVDAALMTAVLPSSDAFAKDLGILNMATVGGGILGPALSSAVIGIGIGFGPLFLVAAGLAFLGALAIVPIKSVK